MTNTEPTPRLLPTKIWTMIHLAIAAMSTAELVERLAHCAQHPADIQPRWEMDHDTRSLTISWGGDLVVLNRQHVAWLLDDSDLVVPQFTWFENNVPDDPSSLIVDGDDPSA